MHRVFKLLKSNSGVSLMQAMMLTGLIGTMAYLNMTVMRQQIGGSRQTTESTKAQFVTKQMKDLLSSPQRCRAFLGNWAPGGVGHPGDRSLGKIAVSEDLAIISGIPGGVVGPPYPATQVLFKITDSSGNSTVAGGESIYSGLLIKGIDTGPSDPDTAGRLSVFIHFYPQRINDYTANITTYTGEIELQYTSANNTNIDTCQAL